MAESNLFVRITGSGKDLINEFTKVGSAADSSTSRTKAAFGNLNKAMQVAGAAIVGTAVAIGVKSFEMADKLETANAKVQLAVKNSGDSWKQFGGAIDKAANSATLFGTSDVANTALAQMISGLGNTQLALKDFTAAENVAAFTGKDLGTAALLVTKAQEGQLRGLKALGIDAAVSAGGLLKVKTSFEALGKAQAAQKVVQEKVTDGLLKGPAAMFALQAATAAVTAAQQKFNDTANAGSTIVGAINKATANAATTMGGTTAGQITKLKNTFGNLEASLGLVLIPVIGKLVAGISDTVTWFQKGGTAVTTAKIAVAAITGVILTYNVALGVLKATQIAVTVAQGIGTAAMFLWNTAVTVGTAATILFAAAMTGLDIAMDANPIGLTVIAVAALTAGIILVAKHVGGFGQLWHDVWIGMKTVAIVAVNGIIDVVNTLLRGLRDVGNFLSNIPGLGGLKNAVSTIGHIPLPSNSSAPANSTGGVPGYFNTGGFSRAAAAPHIEVHFHGPVMGADVESTVHTAMQNITRKNGAVHGVRTSG